MQFESIPKSEVAQVAIALKELIGNSAILFLEGDLAAGKTTFVQELTKLYGATDGVDSPTFSLQQHYRGDCDIYHYDLYRIDFEELMRLGLLEAFELEGLHIVEWPPAELKELIEQAGFESYRLLIDSSASDSRDYHLLKGNDA